MDLKLILVCIATGLLCFFVGLTFGLAKGLIVILFACLMGMIAQSNQ